MTIEKSYTNDKNVDHPSHYIKGKYEVIEIIEDWYLDFRLANALKYIARAGDKNPDKYYEDLKKAQWYIMRYLDNLPKNRIFNIICFKLFHKINIFLVTDDWKVKSYNLKMAILCLYKSQKFFYGTKWLNEIYIYLMKEIELGDR